MEPLTNEDRELIAQARQVISKNFDHEKYNHTVGAALRCKSGAVYLGVNVYLNQGACAETIALGAAITAGERDFETIVAVRGEGDLLPPCGNCRQMFWEYAPNCYVIIPTETGEAKIKAQDLIPYAYTRKID